MSAPPEKILVIRRDNIGDLLCTTPLFTALRRHYPAARITALVNSYNAPALYGNRDLDQVLIYEKAKHRTADKSFWRWLHGRWRVYRTLRSEDFDLVLLATPAFSATAFKFATMTRAKKIVGHGLPTANPDWISVPPAADGQHEVERVFGLLRPLGIEGTPSAMSLTADPAQRQRLLASLPATVDRRRLVALHISARKPRQRWPGERFAELARQLLADAANHLLVFWAPGSATNAAHPGDDEKAAALAATLRALPVSFIRTTRLEELIAGISLCERVICADGGAMHVAAALQKPLVCLFGNAEAARWYPWAVPHRLLQSASQDVSEISVEAVLAAYHQLASEQSDAGNPAGAGVPVG
ncbi:MAG TPA: glycosyltransferase family 9 protein [Accumulibacter sp.]|nr:glycosyltransferase family 9 protein [Accumulibacter sp.]